MQSILDLADVAVVMLIVLAGLFAISQFTLHRRVAH